PPNNPISISVNTSPFIAPIAASTLTGAQFNNGSHNYNLASQIMFAFALMASCETPRSSQVTSDSSVQKEQFKINNPVVPSNYKQKEVLTSLSFNQNSSVINVSTRRNKIISPFLTVPDGIPPTIFYENESSDSNDSDFGENDSDADENVDEARRQLKIQKVKFKIPIIQSSYDLAGTAYLKDENVKVDPH
ncbi:5555_t:CDS:2, partial [Gigaspora rosea]